MKRSKQIDLAFVGVVAAAALAGCNPTQAYHYDWQQCVDNNNVVVEDRLCATPRQAYPGYHGGYYHWLYTDQPFVTGSRISTGRMAPTAGYGLARSSDPAAVSNFRAGTPAGRTSVIERGGFGSSAHVGSSGGGFGGGVGE